MTPTLWVQIVVAIIASLPPLVKVINDVRSGKSNTRQKATKQPVPSRLWRRLVMLSAALLVLDLVSIMFVVMRQSSWDVAILLPGDGATVEQVEMVSGKALRIPEGETLILMVYSDSDKRYFPSTPIYPNLQGDWSVLKAEIGSHADPAGSTYEIAVFAVDRSAQGILDRYFEKVDRAGLPTLPTGVTLCSKVRVKRR